MPYNDLAKQRDYQNRWMQKRRTEWLSAHGPCKTCGSDIDLMVKYTDPESKVEHKVWSWAEDRRLAELAKCHVLCKTCHHAKVTEENGFLLGHGANGYRYNKCRCAICLEAHVEVKRLKAISAKKCRLKRKGIS